MRGTTAQPGWPQQTWVWIRQFCMKQSEWLFSLSRREAISRDLTGFVTEKYCIMLGTVYENHGQVLRKKVTK